MKHNWEIVYFNGRWYSIDVSEVDCDDKQGRINVVVSQNIPIMLLESIDDLPEGIEIYESRKAE